MKTIEYRALYSGGLIAPDTAVGSPTSEVIRVQARDINAGFAKALKIAHEPLGSGVRRLLHSIEFWQVL